MTDLTCTNCGTINSIAPELKPPWGCGSCGKALVAPPSPRATSGPVPGPPAPAAPPAVPRLTCPACGTVNTVAGLKFPACRKCHTPLTAAAAEQAKRLKSWGQKPVIPQKKKAGPKRYGRGAIVLLVMIILGVAGVGWVFGGPLGGILSLFITCPVALVGGVLVGFYRGVRQGLDEAKAR